MGLKGKIEAIIYAAEEPITLEQVAFLMKEPVLQELSVEKERAETEALELAAQQAAESEQNPELDAFEAVQESTQEAAVESVPEPTEESPVAAPEEPASDAPAPEESAARTPDAPVVAEDAAAKDAPVPETSVDEPAAEASESAKPAVSPKRKKNEIPPQVKARVRTLIEELTEDYANNDRGMEIRQLAGGYRMATKPEHHDIVKAFAKSLKPPLRLSLPALETLAVVAYKQPVTAPEVSEIRGVDSQGVMATLLERKLVTTAGRKAVIGRPILYKTTKEFLLRFGMNDVSELPSMEEFEKLAQKEFFSPEAEIESEETNPAAGSELDLAGEDVEGELNDAEEAQPGETPDEQAEATDSVDTDSAKETVEQNLSDTQSPE
jgi:segregation and condensation protein B